MESDGKRGREVRVMRRSKWKGKLAEEWGEKEKS